MLFYLDRIEGDYCVFICNGETVNIPQKLFPDAKEGDKYELQKTTDNSNKIKNEELVNKLFK